MFALLVKQVYNFNLDVFDMEKKTGNQTRHSVLW
jgi:hypothetical protein